MDVITIFELILLCVGIYFIMFKIGWMTTHMHLYDMRKFYASKKYCNELKTCDTALILHYFKLTLFGLYLVLSAMGFTYETHYFLAFIFIMMSCDFGVSIVIYKNNLNALMNSIVGQWKTQFKVSETNDDEVRIVNAVKKLKYSLVKSMIMYAIIIIVDCIINV